MSTVHQILFGWAERDRDGNAGVRPLAHSQPPTIQRWAKRLQHVWATQDGARDVEDRTASLAHLVFEDEAAVLHKLPSRNVHGRSGATLTHVLVGDPRTIDAHLALGLHDWDGWRDTDTGGTPQQLEPLRADVLQRAAETGLAALRREAAGAVPPQDLTALVARMLDDPAADFSVITRPALALPFMTAVLDILGPVPGRPWTFASRESTDVGAHQPRVVFLPARPPTSMYVNKRRRIEPAAAPPDPGATGFAGQLADLYLTAGHRALDRIRPPGGLAGAQDVAAWQRSLPVVAGRICDPWLYRDVLVDDDLLADAERRGTLASVRGALIGVLRDEPADWLTRMVHRWHRSQPRSVRHPRLRDAALAEAVHACFDGGAELDDLVHATAAAQPPPGAVAEAFRSLLPYGELDVSRKGPLRLLVVALHLGLDPAELSQPGLLAPTPAGALLDLVARYAGRWPEAAYAVLRHQLPAAGHWPGDDVAARWYAHDLLLAQVDAIARGDREAELDCYRILLTAAYGPRIGRRDASALLAQAGAGAPAGLLAAALELAADEEAAHPIRYLACERYFREAGYAFTREQAPATPARPAEAEPYAGHRPPSDEPAPHDPPHPDGLPSPPSSYTSDPGSYPSDGAGSDAGADWPASQRRRRTDNLSLAVIVGGSVLVVGAVVTVIYIVLGGF